MRKKPLLHKWLYRWRQVHKYILHCRVSSNRNGSWYKCIDVKEFYEIIKKNAVKRPVNMLHTRMKIDRKCLVSFIVSSILLDSQRTYSRRRRQLNNNNNEKKKKICAHSNCHSIYHVSAVVLFFKVIIKSRHFGSSLK